MVAPHRYLRIGSGGQCFSFGGARDRNDRGTLGKLEKGKSIQNGGSSSNPNPTAKYRPVTFTGPGTTGSVRDLVSSMPQHASLHRMRDFGWPCDGRGCGAKLPEESIAEPAEF
jgi:hypothetical protein